MNILLAFKAEPDLGMLSEVDWQAAARECRGPDVALMRVMMGSDEQGAAELMLQAQERYPQLGLSAVTIGDERALPLLRHLAALGFERRTLITARQDLRFDPAFVAQQIAFQAQEAQSGLVLLGSESSEGQNGQTGWLLAELLGWPCLSGVTEFTPGENGVMVQCEERSRRGRWQLDRPAVLIVRNRGQMALRVPGMRARLAAAKAEVIQCHPHDVKTSSPCCTALVRTLFRRAGERIDGDSAADKACRLWQEYLGKRMMP